MYSRWSNSRMAYDIVVWFNIKTQPPFPAQTPFCLTQTINGGGAITLLADCSLLEVSEIRLESDDFVSITNLLGQPTGLRSGEVLLVITKSGQHKKIFIED